MSTTREKIENHFLDYYWWWIVGFGIFCIGWSMIAASNQPSKPIYVSREDQLIKDAVTLQLRIERQEKEKQEKFDKEYARQKREGR